MSCYRIYYKDGAKMMRPVLTDTEYRNLRNSTKQKAVMKAVRGGDSTKKTRLLQMNYSCLPNDDGTLKGSKRMSTTVGMDIDWTPSPLPLEGEEQIAARKEEWLRTVPELVLSRKDGLGLLMLERSATKGYHLVFKRRPELTQEENLRWASDLLGVDYDEGAKDITRVFFTTTEQELLYLDEEIFKQTPSQLPLQGESGHSAHKNTSTDVNTPLTHREGNGGGSGSGLLFPTDYHGVAYAKIVDAWLGGKKVEAGDRHRTSLCLADHLRYITDNDAALIEHILRETPFVREIVEERNEDVAQTVKSAQGYEFLKGIPRRMREALEKAGADGSVKSEELKENRSAEGQKGAADVYASLPLEAWAAELQELAKSFPCMKELFANVHPMKLPAVLFSSAAMLGTLMTRTWYHFWYEPNLVRRLNYSIFVIGDPGAGKNLIEKIYKILMEPVKERDSELINQVNDYKDSRTERSTSTKAQKGEALKRPIVPIRLHPARTATGEFIRHMQAAKDTIQGRTLYLHMFSFDSELDNVTSNSKGGDWKNRDAMELKAFHNEEDGQMYANTESVTGMFNVYWNFIYTGTPYALGRKVTQRNFGNGLATRLAVIPMPDVGIANRKQKVNPNAHEVLTEWAYRLDKVEGELPIEPLNDETYEWQSGHLEIAEFNGDRADRTLLKRVPYYGIGIAIPFIVMRHWDEWQENHTLTMDEKDRRLCRLAMEIQYRCQHFFFGEMAHNYFEDQGKVFVNRRRSNRYQECYKKLPERFTAKQLQEVFGCSQQAASRTLIRMQADNVVKRVKYGVYKKVILALQ
ncbi:MAG: hypothetical protein K5899_00040 [Bacteroidaceae bacterium]|nr:hypothetical protein [Bacteroidaceae bacterium]